MLNKGQYPLAPSLSVHLLTRTLGNTRLYNPGIAFVLLTNGALYTPIYFRS